jgi:hypothetical protein
MIDSVPCSTPISSKRSKACCRELRTALDDLAPRSRPLRIPHRATCHGGAAAHYGQSPFSDASLRITRFIAASSRFSPPHG